MSTNYYARYNICECCGRYDEMHIGSTYRALQTQTGIRTWEQWCNFLRKPNIKVFDEYGRELEVNEFIQGWTPRPNGELLVKEADEHWNRMFGTPSGDFLDDQGFYFIDRDFS